MAGGSKTTGTVTKTMPGMNDVLGSAKTIFNSGAAWAPNTSSMVTPFAKQTNYGLTGMNNVAKGSIPSLSQNYSRVNQALTGLGSNGLTNLQDQQVNRLQDTAGGNGLNAMQQQAAGYLQPIAAGGQLQNNPYLEDVIKRSSQDIAGANGLSASAAGRYGSGMAQDVTERNIGDMSSNLRFQDYGQQQGRMDNAIQNLFGMGTTGSSQRNDAIGSLYNAGQQGLGNITNGTGQLADAYKARQSPYDTMLNVGKQYENQNQALLNDKARILQETKNAQTDPVNWLANLAGAFQGGQQVTSQPYNPIQQGIGGALSGYGATGSPLMGLLGGLGGLF